ncbi:MAG: plastocyanin/azurin family copper-binding protein [Actinomycetota bacterium]
MALQALIVGLAAAAMVLGLPGSSHGATQTVAVRDNRFDPREIRIDPGDTVIWTNQGGRTHDIKSDEQGEFRSGTMRPGAQFEHTFDNEGYYYYHCTLHGAKGQVGMWGLVIVGDPPPPEGEDDDKDRRRRLVVPDDFPTIQKAVNAATPGTTVVIKPGTYMETVLVTGRNIVIRGVDRFRTVLHGRDKKGNGFVVDGARNVSIKNLTVRNYTGNGIFFNDTERYLAARIDSIKNRTYGIYAFNSYDGVIRDSYGYGSGDSSFYIGQCMACSALIENVVSVKNYLGYSGTNATGVVISDSRFVHNAVGIAPNTLPTEEYAPNRGTIMLDNIVKKNNYETIPAAGISETVGVPYGTGIWFAGIHNGVARGNVIEDHKRYGVLITPSIEPNSVPINNRVWGNEISGSGLYDLAFDGGGENNCFFKNEFETSGPPEIETLYACPNRPFTNAPFGPVGADVAAQIPTAQTREQIEPPEPKRPRCQRGRPGCNR